VRQGHWQRVATLTTDRLPELPVGVNSVGNYPTNAWRCLKQCQIGTERRPFSTPIHLHVCNEGANTLMSGAAERPTTVVVPAACPYQQGPVAASWLRAWR
jgi:hypothetical protein